MAPNDQQLAVFGCFGILMANEMPGMLLRKIGLISDRPSFEVLERVPHRVWQIRYFHMGFIENMCTVIKADTDGSLCLLGTPPMSKEFMAWLAERGTLTVVVEPDAAHNAHARAYKELLGDQVKLLATAQSQALWEESGASSLVDGTFDLLPGSTHAALKPFGFQRHVPARAWLGWDSYAHVFECGAQKLIVVPCPVANYVPSNPFTWLMQSLCGFRGYRVMFHSPHLYCKKEAFTETDGFAKFVRTMAQCEPDLLLFQHGVPLNGKEVLNIQYGLSVPFITQGI